MLTYAAGFQHRHRVVVCGGLILSVAAAVFLSLPVVRAEGDADRRPNDVVPAIAAPTAGWLASIQKDIASSEYHLTWQDTTVVDDLDAAWQAPNRAQGFRTYFTDRGIRVVPRTGEQPAWEWGLTLVRYGRGAVIRPVAAAARSAQSNRINYDRGDVAEWYVNGPKGLKQSFQLGAPPEGVTRPGDRPAKANEPAFLELVLTGDLSPFISADGQVIEFRDPRGRNTLRYAALQANDANGHEVPAWFEGFAEAGVRGIRIVLEDHAATYPVTIDPLATSPVWTAESDQENAGFGSSVATAGDVNGDGYSDVIIGAPFYDNGQADEGRAFVYHGSATGLVATVAWTAESDQTGAGFGSSVAAAGDVNGDGYADVIVGAPLHDNGEVDEGRAYVYYGSASGLASTAAWTAESDQAYSEFATSVATAGDLNGDGYSDVIVGAPYYEELWNDEGQIVAFHGSSGGLTTTAAWTYASGEANANVGNSVSTAGDVNGDGYSDIIVGAFRMDAGAVDAGAAMVFHGSSSGLTSRSWLAWSGDPIAEFGWSVAAAGDVNGDGYADVIVGAPDPNLTVGGRAYVYHGSASGLANSAAWVAESGQIDSRFGVSVAFAGDVNGDGYADVIVGANLFDNVQLDEGRAFLYQGGASGLDATAAWTAESDQPGALFGNTVATAGDVNADGFSDVVVGAVAYNNGETDEGRVYVFHGNNATSLSPTPDWAIAGDQVEVGLGGSVSTAGDVNGDGYSDVIVAAGGYDNGEAPSGRVDVFHGSAAGLPTLAAWKALGVGSTDDSAMRTSA